MARRSGEMPEQWKANQPKPKPKLSAKDQALEDAKIRIKNAQQVRRKRGR